MLRVVILDHTANLGGAELALTRLLDHTPAGIHAHTILFSHGPLAAHLRSRGHAVEVLPLHSGLATAHRATTATLPTAAAHAARALPFTLRLARRLRALDPDVIHTTSLKADLLGLPAARLAGRPLVWHVHDRIAPDYLPAPTVHALRFLARHGPDHVVANSAATAGTLPGVRALTVAHPGFAPEQAAARPAPTPAGCTPPDAADPPVVGILGRISPTKGQLEFVRAAARVLPHHPHARFRIIGDALFGEQPYAARVRAEARALGIAHRVEFTGHTTRPADALDALTLLVHASGTPEPFGQVIVEAMVRGVPVVATRGGGVTEILEPPGCAAPLGWLVPPHDDAALAAAITHALAHPELAQARAHAAWESAHERFRVELTAARVAEVWRRAAAR